MVYDRKSYPSTRSCDDAHLPVVLGIPRDGEVFPGGRAQERHIRIRKHPKQFLRVGVERDRIINDDWCPKWIGIAIVRGLIPEHGACRPAPAPYLSSAAREGRPQETNRWDLFP